MRGTIPARIDNDLVDIYSWFSSAVGTDWYDTLPSYFPQAIVFARKVHTYLKKYYPNLKRITYTGHSLGGALAQLVALRGRPHKAVVFNSPGCKEIAGPYYEQRKNLITSVNARYGVINKIGEPVLGNLTVIDVPNLEADAKNLLTHFHHADFIKATKLARLAELESGVLPLFINSAALSALYRIESVTDSITSIQHPLIDVITAQHSIQNLIQAIGNKQTIEVVGVAA
jgi:pimeloyl-ACP methyl ester carboxylesterase